MREWKMPKWMEPYRQFLMEPDDAETYKNSTDGRRFPDTKEEDVNYIYAGCLIELSEIAFLYKLRKAGIITAKTDKKSHRERHKELHRHLDELVADCIAHNPNFLPSKSTVLDLMEWSCEQTKDPIGEQR